MVGKEDRAPVICGLSGRGFKDERPDDVSRASHHRDSETTPKKNRAPAAETHTVKAPANVPVLVKIGHETEAIDVGVTGDIPGGYTKLANRVIDSQIFSKLPVSSKALYPVLCRIANLRENRAHPDGWGNRYIFSSNAPQMSRMSGMSVSALWRAISGLKNHGLLKLVKSGRDTRESSTYQLLIPVEGYKDINPLVRSRDNSNLPQNKPKKKKKTKPTDQETVPSAGRIAPHQRDGQSPVSGALDVPPAARIAPHINVDDIAAGGAPSNQSSKPNLKENSSKAADVLLRLGIETRAAYAIASSYPAERILLHARDFEVRNALLPEADKLKSGWLVKAIAKKYDIHKDTQKSIDADRRRQADLRRQEQLQAEAKQRAIEQRERAERFDKIYESMTIREKEKYVARVIEDTEDKGGLPPKFDNLPADNVAWRAWIINYLIVDDAMKDVKD